MHKGIYIALSGAVLKQAQMDMISNNLANAATTGFKRDKISFQEFLLSQMNNRTEPPDGRTMSFFGTTATDYIPGSIVQTGNALDVAIEGDGMLSLENGQYTRRGDLKIGNDGYIITNSGIRVMGSAGPIRIPRSGSINISDSGEVSVDNIVAGSLKIVDFKDGAGLKKSGEDTFTAAQAGTASKSAVKQGYIEKSNVDVVKEMVQMITALREFETYQKAIQTFDESIGRVLTDMPRI